MNCQEMDGSKNVLNILFRAFGLKFNRSNNVSNRLSQMYDFGTHENLSHKQSALFYKPSSKKANPL